MLARRSCVSHMEVCSADTPASLAAFLTADGSRRTTPPSATAATQADAVANDRPATPPRRGPLARHAAAEVRWPARGRQEQGMLCPPNALDEVLSLALSGQIAACSRALNESIKTLSVGLPGLCVDIV